MDLQRVDDYHLHLTVEPRNKGQAMAYAAACGQHWKPLVLENIPTGLTELVPTMELNCEFGQAMILLHDAAKLWAMKGWLVPRVKIEARRRCDDALYAEAHVLIEGGGTGTAQLLATTTDELKQYQRLPLSRSLTSGKLYATLRSVDASEEAITHLRKDIAARSLLGRAKLEWAVYDSNRERDRAWFAQWGRTE